MTVCTVNAEGHAYGLEVAHCPICQHAPLYSLDASEEKTIKLTNARARELLAELSLVDLCRLTLTKAGGPEGLGGGTIAMETDDLAIHIRPIRKKRKRG